MRRKESLDYLEFPGFHGGLLSRESVRHVNSETS
jgi:hypothetical protein